jgi:predicted GTPase
MWDWLSSFLLSFLGLGNKPQTPRLVIGLNQVDKIVPNGWDERLNKPTKKAEEEIERRCKDIIQRLGREAEIAEANIEYYSALKRYRLINLLNKVIQNSYAGFKLSNVNPKDPFELAEEDVQNFADEERKKRPNNLEENTNYQMKTEEQIKKEMGDVLSKSDMTTILKKLEQETKSPPKVAVIGKSGVGKTTTINNLFNAQLKTSSTTVGTTEAQTQEFTLPTGGTLNVVDLPGYGRSEAEDKEYEKIYQDLIPSCDLVFLVLQANTRDFSDDIEMITKIQQWLKNDPIPKK